MTLPFNNDNSIQSNFNFYTSNLYDGFATSNYVISNVNLKQNVLTAATNLLGVGSGITSLDYNKITLNKPTNFQSDWNSTIINKPSYFPSDWGSTVANRPTYFPIDPSIYYNKTETNNLLSAKEQILTFNAPLTRTINTIAINLNSYPTYTNLNSCNYITNATNTLTNYPSYTVLNSCNYITNATNTLTNYPSYTVLNSCNYINNATNTLVNYYTKTQSDANYLLKTGGAMTGQITGVTTLNGTTGIFGTISTTNNTNTNTPQLGVYGGTGDKFILYTGTASVYPYSLGINNLVFWYSVPSTASHIFYVAGNPITTISNTGLSTTGLINASTNLQEAGTNLSSKYLQLSGGNITGNLGLNVASPQVKLDIDGSILLRTAVGTSGGTGGIFFRNGFATSSYYNCSILTYDHNSNTFCDGISINGFDGVSICTGANTRQERMRIDESGNVNIGTTGQSYKLYVNGTTYFNNNSTINGTLTTTNGITTGTSVYSYFGGLRINGDDTGNTIYNANKSLGLTCLNTMLFNTGTSLANYGTRLTIDTSGNVRIGYGGTVNTASTNILDVSGNQNISGELTVNGQTFAGGLRINGGDGNTLFNYGRDLGLLVNSTQSINFSMWGGNGNIMTVNNSGVVIDVDGVPINITNKGIVIGTFTTQYYPFVVSRTINGTLSYVYVRTGWNGGGDYNTNSITGDTSAVFAGQILVEGNILNKSDIRIKKEINDITDDGALQQILAIQPKTYKYIDYLSKNNSTVYGFIAQQVKEVIPHAVELVKGIIPNIYKRAICDSNIITLENDVSQDLNLNDNIKIYDEFGNDNMYNITEINSNVIKIDKDINTSNIFVFGKEVDDFHTLKKDYIFTLNVCATQELYKLIQNQNIIIENLQLQINELKNKIIL
jgi:hypothetical protein